MNTEPPKITDPNDPRITEKDYRLAETLTELIRHNLTQGMAYERMWMTAAKISEYRRKSICEAAGIAGDDPGDLAALVWRYRGGENHIAVPETWKDHVETWKNYAEDLQNQIDAYEQREAELAEFERLNLESARLAEEEREKIVASPSSPTA